MGAFIIKTLVVLLLLLLVILALPLRYGVYAAWHQDKGTFDWYLNWAWVVKLDKLVQSLQPQEDTPPEDTAKPQGNGVKKKSAAGSGSPRKPEPPSLTSSQEEASAESASAARKAKAKMEEPLEATGEREKYASETTSTREQVNQGLAQLQEVWQERSWLWRWLIRFGGTLHLTPLYIQGSLGLDDPYQTNSAFRHFFLLRGFLPSGIRLELAPDYRSSRVEVQLQLSGWLSPLHFLAVTGVFLLDRTSWRLWRLLRQ